MPIQEMKKEIKHFIHCDVESLTNKEIIKIYNALFRGQHNG